MIVKATSRDTSEPHETMEAIEAINEGMQLESSHTLLASQPPAHTSSETAGSSEPSDNLSSHNSSPHLPPEEDKPTTKPHDQLSLRFHKDLHQKHREDFKLPNGVWMSHTESSMAFRSRESMEEAVDLAESIGVNAIYPVVWNKQQFFFHSQTVAQTLDPDFITHTINGTDPLHELIDISRSRNLDIYPCLESGLKVAMKQKSSQHETAIGKLVSSRDQWLTRNQDGHVIEMCHFDVCFSYLNPLHPEVREFLIQLTRDLLENYKVDGVIFDDHFSLPAYITGCDPLIYEVKSYNTRYLSWLRKHRQQRDDYERCRQFSNLLREEMIMDLFKEFHKIAVASGKKLLLSPAGIPSWSKREWLQDWKEMVRRGHLDGVIMQVFRGLTFKFMLHSPELRDLKRYHSTTPIGVVILLGLKKDHRYAYGERIYRQTLSALNAGRSPSFYYHEMVPIPVEGKSVRSRMSWIQKTKELFINQQDATIAIQDE